MPEKNEKREVTQRWEGYCKELYNKDIDTDEKVVEELKQGTDRSKGEEPYILKRERLQQQCPQAIVESHKGRQHLREKPGGGNVVKFYTKLCNKVVETGWWPQDWTMQ